MSVSRLVSATLYCTATEYATLSAASRRGWRKSVSAGVALRQRVQQHPGFLQVGGVKALSEPAVNLRQQLAGFDALALLLPQATQAHRHPQLQRLGLLAASDVKGLTKAGFSLWFGRPSLP